MNFSIFLLAVFVFYTGLSSLFSLQSQSTVPPQAMLQSVSEAQLFISYRNAVGAYVLSHTSFTGTVPDASLQSYLAPGQVIPSGFSNNVVMTSSGKGQISYAWGNLAQSSVYFIAQALQGDPSVGIVSGAQWISPVYGSIGLPLPAYIPDKAVLSVVQVGY